MLSQAEQLYVRDHMLDANVQGMGMMYHGAAGKILPKKLNLTMMVI